MNKSKLNSEENKSEQNEDTIARISEALKIEETTHKSLLALCAFSFVTFNSFEDLSILLNSKHTAAIPLIGISLSTVSLMWFIPSFIFLIFYYQLLINSKCYSHYTDLNEKPESTNFNSNLLTYNFIADDLIALRFDKKKDFKLEYIFYYLYLYTIPPLTMGFITFSCIKKSDMILTLYQLILFLVSCYVAICITILQSNRFDQFRKSKVAFIIFSITILVIPFFRLPYILSNTDIPKIRISLIDDHFYNSGLEPGLNLFYNLRNSILSVRPDFLSENDIESIEKYSNFVVGVDLSNKEMVKANLERSFLVRANLKDCNLQSAYLRGSNLSYADLRKANLKGAYIRLVNFYNADLREANLMDALIQDAEDPNFMLPPNFQYSRFNYKIIDGFPLNMIDCPVKTSDGYQYYTNNLQLSYFGLKTNEDICKFSDCSVVGQMLKKFDFCFLLDSEINSKIFSGKIFSPNFSWENAFLQNAKFESCSFTGVMLRGIKFKKTKLQCVDFSKSRLDQATFIDCYFKDVNFEKVDLSTVTFTNCEALNCKPDNVEKIISKKQ